MRLPIRTFIAALCAGFALAFAGTSTARADTQVPWHPLAAQFLLYEQYPCYSRRRVNREFPSDRLLDSEHVLARQPDQ